MYGAAAPEGDRFAPVKFDPAQRAGIFTHPFLLAAFSYHKSTSPIHRGVFLCDGAVPAELREAWGGRMEAIVVSARDGETWTELMRRAEDRFVRDSSAARVTPTGSGLLTSLESAMSGGDPRELTDALNEYFKRHPTVNRTPSRGQ